MMSATQHSIGTKIAAQPTGRANHDIEGLFALGPYRSNKDLQEHSEVLTTRRRPRGQVEHVGAVQSLDLGLDAHAAHAATIPNRSNARRVPDHYSYLAVAPYWRSSAAISIWPKLCSACQSSVRCNHAKRDSGRHPWRVVLAPVPHPLPLRRIATGY